MAIFTLRTLEANGPERPAPMIRDESRRTRDFLKKELPILRAVDVVKAAHSPILQPRNSQILDELGSNTKRGQAIDVRLEYYFVRICLVLRSSRCLGVCWVCFRHILTSMA